MVFEAKVKPSRITFHCSASPNGKDLPASVIDEMHKKRGWKGCGYHYVIQPSALIEHAGNSPCRGLNEEGAGVEGANKDNVHMCLVGLDKFRYSQLWALKRATEDVMMLYGIPPWNLRAHYGFPSAIKQGKTCPNIPIENLIMWTVWGDIKAVENHTLDAD